MTGRSVVLGRLALVLLAVLGALGVVEISLRLWPPPPRVQIVHGEAVRLRMSHGVPVWTQTTERQNDACVEEHPERIRILFLGDSITFGSGVDAPEVFTALLETRLNSLLPQPGFCVMNYAQPGFGMEQSVAIAAEVIPRLKPKVVLWGIWDENRRAVMLGDTAYGIEHFLESGRGNPRDADGYPCVGATCTIPWGLNRWLFLHSEAWKEGTLRYGREDSPRPPASMSATIRKPVAEVISEAEAAGARLVLFYPCLLDRPFGAGAEESLAWHAALTASAREHGFPAVELGAELAGRNLASLGVDQVHFNREGHRLLVPIFERLVLGELAKRR